MKDRSLSLGHLAPEQFLRVDAICNRFESKWRAGRRPRIEDYLVIRDAPEFKVLLQELILLDVECRVHMGEVPCVADYTGRFPGVELAWFAVRID
jgi:hypothetical protein